MGEEINLLIPQVLPGLKRMTIGVSGDKGIATSYTEINQEEIRLGGQGGHC